MRNELMNECVNEFLMRAAVFAPVDEDGGGTKVVGKQKVNEFILKMDEILKNPKQGNVPTILQLIGDQIKMIADDH